MPGPGLKTAKELNADSFECVLLIESQANDAARISDELSSATPERFHVDWVTELSSAIEHLRGAGVGAVVLDLALSGSQGLETFKQIFQAAPRVPILILSGADTEEMARQAVRLGAQDYLLKNQADGYRLRQAVRAVINRSAAEAIMAENESANVTLDLIGEAVLRTDIHGTVTYLNRVAEKMTGWSREEALGRPVADVLQIVDGVSGGAVRNAVEVVIQEDKTASVTANCTNCILVRRDGFEFGIENRVTPIYGRDGSVTGTVVAFHDVSEARARSLEMSHLAQHDFLTDLPNRMLFNDRLTQAISLAVRQGRQLALMFVDLDHFKKINDSLGHGVGDKLLQSVAGRLVACVRRTDTVSRLGGDEFVILLSQVEHAEDAAFSARKILRSLAAPHLIDNRSLDINVSIGVSTYPSDGPDAESLMNKADTAMYEAKQLGRNNYQFFRRDMHARLADRQLLEGDLRYALGRKEFLLHYQPKCNLRTGQITGMEALIRWVHPRRGIVYPAQFISIAEECGLILPIGRWVLLEACKQVREWSDSGLGVVPVAVNVSAAEFSDKDFLSGVRAVLIATGVEPPNLELELTESVLMQDAESTVRALSALKAMGVQLAIDDFGTGYSSFAYLRRFPVDALKLHQSFVQEITVDPGDATIVSAMINIGRSLKQRVIAEGVETRAQLNFLQRHECGEGQGYYFSHPVAAEQAGKLLETGIPEAVIH
ncbi:MAG: putative bifunctional diguanylate cyclase/phosphodiesterase [Candidatus Acidiferrales bacterium]